MTYRTVCNQTELQVTRMHCEGATLENQIDNVALAENNPYNVNYAGGDVVFKGNSYRPCPAPQHPDGAPVFIIPVNRINLVQGVEMTPYNFAAHFAQGETYAITTTPTGLAFDTGTGILSGTPTNVGGSSPFVTATNGEGSAQSNTFTIAVSVA